MPNTDLFPESFVDINDTVTVNGVVSGNVNSAGMPITNVRQALENFWKWFDDSEVVDDKGRPLVVYHGTKADISKFEIGRLSKNSWAFGNWDVRRHGVFTTPNRDFSGNYATQGSDTSGANIMSVYLKIDRLFDFTKGAYGLTDEQYNALQSAGLSMRWLQNRTSEWEAFDNEGGAHFVEVLKKLGYDGAKIYEDGEEVYIAFSPNQLKSVTGNIGRYHPEKDDISEIKKLSGISESVGDPTYNLYSEVSKAIPGMYALTDLKNQDPYLQYRFGVAMAGALAKKEGLANFEKESKYGENMIVIAPTEAEREIVKLALADMNGLDSIEQLSSIPSEERTDTYVDSAIGSKPINESDEEYYKELEQMKKIAGIGNSNNDSAPLLGWEEKNRQAMVKVNHMKEHNIKPGTPEWFRLWFARPELTKETPF